jgi:hypothetical protein
LAFSIVSWSFARVSEVSRLLPNTASIGLILSCFTIAHFLPGAIKTAN